MRTMQEAIDETGRTHGLLKVLERVDNVFDKEGCPRAVWKCLCQCGNITTVAGTTLRFSDGRWQISCGCRRKEVAENTIRRYNKVLRPERNRIRARAKFLEKQQAAA